MAGSALLLDLLRHSLVVAGFTQCAVIDRQLKEIYDRMKSQLQLEDPNGDDD